MKYIEEYRNKSVASQLAHRIAQAVTQPWTIMEVCGGQTHAILQYGLQDLLPDAVRLVHGPGCPVCVTPLELIDKAVAIAETSGTILCSFGDMLRVPGSRCDLLTAKANGADVRMVYSPLDSVKLAQVHTNRRIVFFAVGFETTAPANAMAVMQAKKLGLDNFSMLCSHVLVPPVMAAILQSPHNTVQAFLGPGHVCTIMGWREYEALSAKFAVPVVITGFEPVDMLEGILRCVIQLEAGEARVENQYARAVRRGGNAHAACVLEEVFDVCDRSWRGLGAIPKSGLKLSHRYRHFDAEYQFHTQDICVHEPEQCIAGYILRGLKKPFECEAFGTTCTPENPLGATMVSAEGTCANYYKFGRFN